eukprot:scaffold550_cov303-Pavlova_lutheri.AAC.7
MCTVPFEERGSFRAPRGYMPLPHNSSEVTVEDCRGCNYNPVRWMETRIQGISYHPFRELK